VAYRVSTYCDRTSTATAGWSRRRVGAALGFHRITAHRALVEAGGTWSRHAHGFSPDQARSFAPTPQEFQFGVCAAPSTDPHCTVDPGAVPKAMDVLTPPGEDQAGLLDDTIHQPVTLEAVTTP
jgi:hypothetical protein